MDFRATPFAPPVIGRSPSASDERPAALQRFEKQLTNARSKLDRGQDAKVVHTYIGLLSQATYRELIKLDPEHFLSSRKQMQAMLQAYAAQRPHDVAWQNILSSAASAQKLVIAPAREVPAPTRAVATPQPAQGLRDAIPLPARPRAMLRHRNVPSLPLRSAQQRLAGAKRLSSKASAAAPEASLAQAKVQGAAEGTRIKLDGVHLAPVFIERPGAVRRVPFRVTYVPDTGEGDLFYGSMMASGSYSKVRPALHTAADRATVDAVAKELRVQERRDGHRKELLNRLGRRVNVVASEADFDQEVALARLLGGPVKVLATYRGASKLLLVLTRMHASLDAIVLNPSEASAFTREVGAKLAAHLVVIHAAGYAHLDVKLNNALINFKSREVAHADFGLSQKLDEKGRIAGMRGTYYSPEALREGTVGVKQDTWTLGILLMQLALTELRKSNPLDLRPGPAGSAQSTQSLRLLEKFEEMRQSLMKPTHPDPLDCNEIDPKKLRDPSLATKGYLGLMLHTLAQRDETLAIYILEHLLDPNETRRHDASLAVRTLTDLARIHQRDAAAVFARLALTQRQSVHEGLFQRLHVAKSLVEDEGSVDT